jgi:endonuclease YncB( thermonuclease family)
MKKILFLGILSTIFFISPSMLQAEELKSSALPQVQTYGQLVSAIRQARAASQSRVVQAVQQEKVREAWETGKLIDEHVLQHKERADYGEQVLERLSGDLGVSASELRRMLEFARAYPIYAHARKLSWSDYRELLSINNSEERDALAEQAEKGEWTRDQIREEVKKRKASGTGPASESGPVPLNLLPSKPGKPGTYRIVKATVGPEKGKWVIDLGFSNYYKTSKDLRFKEGAIIEATPPFAGGSSPSDLIRFSKRAPEDLYTYRAWVVRVLDGDTVEVVVDLGFGVRSVQTLRLRGLDCPELVSKEGKEAKAFVESVIASPVGAKQSQPFVLIKTVKSDKYDRYLADIFYSDKTGTQVYLNNLLLEKGHAVRVRD